LYSRRIAVNLVSFELFNTSGEPIRGDMRFQSGRVARPAVVICHSFMAFKNWGWFPYVAERLAQAGFVSVSFNFSRSGVNEPPDRITDFDAFASNTISHELEDLEVVLKAIVRGEIGKYLIDPGRIALLGHSRGAAIALLAAAGSENVSVLVSWSSVATFDRWTEHQKTQWRKAGFLPLSKDSAISPLLNDIEGNRGTLDLVGAAARVRVPWLIVHGSEDLIVRFSEAEQLFAASDQSKTTLIPLKKVGHLYGGPEVTPDSAIHRVLDETIQWLKRAM